MIFVSGNNFVDNIFSNCGEKLLILFWGSFYFVIYIWRCHSSIWLYFSLIRYLTASQVCLEFVLCSLKKCFVVVWFVDPSKSIYHAIVSFKFYVVDFFGMENFDPNKFPVYIIFLIDRFWNSFGKPWLIIAFRFTCLSSTSAILLENVWKDLHGPQVYLEYHLSLKPSII